MVQQPDSLSVSSRPPPKQRVWSWRSQAFRGTVYQIVALAVLLAAAAYLLHNTFANMRMRGIQSGFSFILQPAGFGIGESLLPFDSSNSYLYAYVVALSNTLRVALLGIVLATVLGTVIGIGRLSRNALVSTLCGAYVEITRNVPLLLQLFIWYFILTESLPPIEEAWQANGFFFSKNGLQFPLPVAELGAHLSTLGGTALGLVAAWWYARQARLRRESTGAMWPVWWPSVALVVGLTVLGWMAGGMHTEWDIPERTELNVVGGGSVTPEYLTVLLGLTIYTAGYIAEVVRAGIQSVPYGQHEAAASLGLSRAQELRLVLLPQALRVIIPPITSQYLNLTKNSSLAVAVGYPDLVSISSTSLNQTGRAIECIALVMACYLTMSLLTSAFMNFYNARARLKDR